jgi:hypothetical protein
MAEAMCQWPSPPTGHHFLPGSRTYFHARHVKGYVLVELAFFPKNQGTHRAECREGLDIVVRHARYLE